MIRYVVIDTNVLVSALLTIHSGAATVQLVRRMLGGEINAHLVTGNLKHFPEERFIVTARQMLAILDGKEEF